MAHEGFFDAYDSVLQPLILASNTLSLVSGADAVGLLTALRTASTVQDLSVRTGLETSRTTAMCTALRAIGVTETADALHQLTPPWLALTDPGAMQPLKVLLAASAVDDRLLAAADSISYWTMSTADRIAYARATSPNPFSDELVAAFGRILVDNPDQAPMLQGGRMLEFGCGLAGRLLTTLRAAPRLSAVGVELSSDLADEARRRAAELGLADRVQIVCGDAATFTDPAPFDFAFWSQFFFPADTRQAALQALLSNMRSGAVLFAPLGVDYEQLSREPDGVLARAYALWRLNLDSWGVPEHTAVSLVAEIAHAGFTEVRVVSRGGEGPVVRATRP